MIRRLHRLTQIRRNEAIIKVVFNDEIICENRRNLRMNAPSAALDLEECERWRPSSFVPADRRASIARLSMSRLPTGLGTAAGARGAVGRKTFRPPPGLLSKYPLLRETPSADPDQRTAWNVHDSDATLILVRSDDPARSPGTNFAKRAAELIFQKPCLVADLSGVDSRAKVERWLAELVSTPGRRGELVLHIAGPRESESPGIYLEAKSFLAALLTRFRG